MTDLDERLRDAARNATSTVVGHPRTRPAEVFAELAKASDDLGIDEEDRYGDGGAVALLEQQVAELLGKPAAVFFVAAPWPSRRCCGSGASGEGRAAWPSPTSRTS